MVPSIIGLDTVKVVPEATSKVGSLATVIVLAMVMSAVVARVAEVVVVPTKSIEPVPNALLLSTCNFAPALTWKPPAKELLSAVTATTPMVPAALVMVSLLEPLTTPVMVV